MRRLYAASIIREKIFRRKDFRRTFVENHTDGKNKFPEREATDGSCNAAVGTKVASNRSLQPRNGSRLVRNVTPKPWVVPRACDGVSK